MASKLKVARKQVFLKTYMHKFPFVRECSTKGEDNPFYAHCNTCGSDFYIGSAGAADIRRHEKTLTHKDKTNRLNDPNRLDKFLQNRKASMDSEKERERKEEKERAEAKEKLLKENMIRAEVIMVELIAELNLSINTASTFTHAFKRMFPDSEIARNFQCARTKATAIVKDLALNHKKLLLERMKNGPFSLSTDGSNDANSKLFPIVVRTINPESLAVEAEVVSLPVLEDSATGENIFNLLDSLLVGAGVSWKNCVAFGCDIASVMTGVHKGVMSFILKKNPNCVMSGCTLHLVHIAAEKAANQLPYQPADLLIDIFYYMKKSSVRQRNLGKWQLYYNNEQKKVLKHVATRWLSIGKCIDRLIEDWRPLRAFFENECKVNKVNTAAHTKAKLIYNTLCSETAKVSCLFLKHAVKLFEPFLTSYQSDSPMIPSLHSSMGRLMMDVLNKFVKPSACTFKDAFDVQYGEEFKYNIKDSRDISLGCETEMFMKRKNFSKQKRSDFIASAVGYYRSVCNYLKSNLPHDNKFLDKVSSATPENLVKDQSISKLKYIMFEQPSFIPAGATIDTIESELCRLQHTILANKLPEAERLDERWAKQAIADPDTKSACLFLLNLLVVPHSSASCEQVFSFVRKIKTDQRGQMGDALLESLIICKHIPGSCIQRYYSSEMLAFLKQSCMRANSSTEAS